MLLMPYWAWVGNQMVTATVLTWCLFASFPYTKH
jgi:hypothetical protein